MDTKEVKMKIQRIFTAVFLAFALLLYNVSAARAMPPMPSSFNGTVKLDGAYVPAGTIISARINGVEYATMSAILYEGETVYFFEVPGEDPEVPGIQGGVTGDTVVFYIGNYVADQTAPWLSGLPQELNLTGTTYRTVTFNSNGGTGSMSPQTANILTALTPNAFTRLGYSFSNWNTAADGSGTNYADGASYSFTANITLYAQWTALPMRTVIFNSNGGTGTMSNQTANVPTALTANTFTRTGYTFSGWNTNAGGTGTAYADTAVYPFTADATLYAQWTALPMRTVIFNNNGGAGTMSNQTANIPTALTANTFTRTGYTFSGWNTNAGGTGTAYADTAVYSFAADVTLYAQWTVLPNHTVTFNSNSGSGTMTPQVANIPTALTANTFTRSGYNFAGWNTTANGSGTAYANNAIYPFAADVTLYAQWTANTYTVTFDANGGGTPTPVSKLVTFDAAYGTMATTSRTGYTFSGWFTAASGGTQVNAATIVSNPSNHTLYAQWSINTYTVTFNANGGSGTMSNQTGNYNTTAPLTLNAFTRTGYTFSGWNTASGGGGTGYADGANYTFTANITLYAQWTVLPMHTVIFNSNGGAGTMSNQTANIPTALTANTFTRTGYSFGGWNTAANGSGTAYANNAVYPFAADATLYAQWTANTYTVTFDANGGGTPTPANKTVTFDAAYGTLATISRTGYTFNGWFTAASGGTQVTAATIVGNASNHTLYAQWSINTYTVTFNANGGSGTMSNQTGNYNTTAPLTLNAFTRTGYTFSGWNTVSGGGGTGYADGANYTFTANVTLYAQWSINTYTVTFNANSGSGTMGNQTGTYNTTAPLTLNAFTRTGYSFSSWNTASGGGGTGYADGSNYTFTANITLYAQWTALPMHTVTFNSNGGSGTMSNQSANVPTALTANTFTRSGYNFAGWNTAANGSGTAYANNAIYPFAVDANLYAQWSTLPNHTVTFNSNGGSGTMSNQIANVPTVLTLNAFTRLGYSFSGWNTNAGGTGSAYGDGATYSFSADITLYAQWTALPMHTVIFNSNGGTGTMSNQTTNIPTALTANTFTRSGYNFAGWNTQAGGGGTSYANGATYSFAANATLYAQWTALPMHTVTFNNNGGAGTMSNQTANVPTALTLNAFTRTGYWFSGWNTAASGSGTAYADGATYSFTANVTLYAQWSQITAITVTGITVNNKVYSGDTTASLNTSGYNFIGVASGDIVTLVTTGATTAFDNENVGNGKPVTVSGLGLSGKDAYKYTLTQPTVSGNIIAKGLTVSATANNKVYDGTTAATVTLSTDALAGDLVTASSTSADFATKDVHTGKTVTVSGISISGVDAGNYHLLNIIATDMADITPAELTVTADNQTIVAGASDPIFTYGVSGFVAPDTFLTAPTCSVVDPHAVVGAYDITCTSGDAGVNYTITYVKGTLTVSAANNPPTDISLSASSVNENKPIGTTVGTLTATDPDAGDTHTYSLGCAVPGVDDVSFTIAANAVQTAAIFDYETKNSYAICVRSDDGHSGTFDKNFTISVNNLIEPKTLVLRSVALQDGWVLETGENTNLGGVTDVQSTTLRLGDDVNRKQYRSILSFATGAGLPDNAVVTKVTLKFRKQGISGGGNPITMFQGLMVDIRRGLFGTTAIQATDWQGPAHKSIGPFKPVVSGGWYTLNLTNLRGYVNKLTTSGGVTQLRLRFKLDDNGDSAANVLSIYSGNAGISSRPQLIVEYYVP
jgi:uncharacterized repeat protein (TIGR02543 family)